MKKSKVFILGLVLCCILACYLIFGVDWVSFLDVTHIEGADNYSKLYRVFPEKLPDSAEETIYSYYLFDEQEDIYLELKFSDRGSMEQYVNQIKEQLGEKIFMKENPQNPSYTDCFSSIGSASRADQQFDYYEIETDDNERVSEIDLAYTVMSFSYDDLTVITARMSGRSLDSVLYEDDSCFYKIPKYFTRFGIDVTKDSEYYVYFPES